MMARLSLDSFLLVPMGTSDREYQLAVTMLASTFRIGQPNQQELLESTVSLIVDMRVDGVLLELAYRYEWTPAQGRHGDRELHTFSENAKAHLLAIFRSKIIRDTSAIDDEMDGIMYCLWAMYDSACDFVCNAVTNAASKPLAIEKKTPPQNLA